MPMMMPRFRGGVNVVVARHQESDRQSSQRNSGEHHNHNMSLNDKRTEEQTRAIRAEISALNILKARVPMAESLAYDIALAAQAERNEGLQHSEEELLKLAKEKIEKRSNFCKLLSLLLFFALYATALLLQHNGAESYNLESSVIMNNVMSSLPLNGAGASFFNGGGPGSTGLLSTNDDFYSWFKDSIIAVMFKDSVCGDGVCDYPEEVKAVGRFGCEADCGKVPDDTIVTVRVDLKTVMQRRFFDQINLGDRDPGFRYNIFSKKFNDYVFENFMEPSGVMVHTFEALRTDSFELRFFQTNSLASSVDIKDIQLLYHFGDGTLPERTTDVPWGYGDKREVLAVSQYQLSKVQEYCLNRMGDLYNARVGDPVCSDAVVPYPQGFPNYFTPLGIGLQILRSYGITGDITVPTVNEYGKKVLVSLVRPPGASSVGAAIKYCGPLPPSNATVDTLPTGADFVKLINNAGAPCSPTSGRRKPWTWFDRSPPPLEEGEYSALKSSTEFEKIQEFVDVTRSSNDVPYHALRHLLDNGSAVINPTVDDVGTDDRGFWKCYTGPNDVKLNARCWESNAQWYFDSYNLSNQYGYQSSVFVAVDISYQNIPIFQTNEKLKAAVNAWKSNAGAAPGLANASLQLRYSTDFATNWGFPHCRDLFVPLEAVKQFEYDFKTRLRLWNSNISQLQVWLCNLSDPSAGPMFTTSLNVTDKLIALGRAPLGPGPSTALTLSVKKQLDDRTVQAVQQRLCQVVWSTLDDRCKSRTWTLLTSQSGNSVSVGRRADSPWQLSFTWLFVSNSRATRASYLITQDVNSADFKATFPDIDLSAGTVFSTVNAPGPSPKLDRTSPYSCLSHYDCGDGLFCSTASLTTAAEGFRGGGGPGPSGYGCDLCQFCLSDNTDPVDSWCPRDKCGKQAGSYPACVDANKMLAPNFRCKTAYPLYMDRVPAVIRTSNEPEQIPLSNPNSTKRKARFLMPYNQLVGSLVLTQTRRSGQCIFRNDSISRYARLKEPQLGAVCRGNDVETAPYGSDPAFIGSSSLFRGDLQPTSFYSTSELDNSSLPYGFFPHSYDQKLRGPKPSQYVMRSEADTFKIYFTERQSSAYAQRFVTYLEDGGFLDQSTETLTVEIPTLNSNLNFFGIYTFTFNWEAGGKITWDYSIKSIPIYQYDDSNIGGRVFLEILLVVMLGLNCISEFTDVLRAIKQFDVMPYFSDAWNVIDWIHFGLMWGGWYLWLDHVRMTQSLQMPAGFKVLTYPAPETAARLIATNPDGEYAFLTFLDQLKSISQNLGLYNHITSICVLLFVLRLLKVADFQPRIALVTRTLGNAILDLMHFLTLYGTILLGYAIAGVLLFGHQYEGYKTLSNSIFSLIILMIAWDPSQWVQLNHSAPQWAFHIFIWSWIWLAVFILLNILLAILVEGYMGVKKLTEEMNAPGLLTDLYGVLAHECKRLLRCVWRSYPFVSDDEVVARLEKKLGAKNESSLQKALRDYHAMSVAGLNPIQTPDGSIIGNEEINAILQDLFPDRLLARSDSEKDGSQLLEPAVREFMSRYSNTNGPPDFDSKQQALFSNFAELSRLDSLKRLAQIHLHLISPTSNAFADQPTEDIELAMLHVTIEKARNLPKMDVGAGVDVFCLIFFEGAPDLHRTEVRRGFSEQDWTWDPELSQNFKWNLPLGSSLMDPERKIVILVYDKDQLSSDDLIGVINIKLGEVMERGKLLDEWRKVIRPPDAPKKQWIFWSVPDGEIKVKINLSQPAGKTPQPKIVCDAPVVLDAPVAALNRSGKRTSGNEKYVVEDEEEECMPMPIDVRDDKYTIGEMVWCT